MPIDFHYMPGSAPCRAVQITASVLGIDLNLKLTDLQKGEHLTPEYIKLNPQHTIPTLVDGGFSLWESRAIIAYLVNQYGKDDALYPKDPKKRAVVDQRLYFDCGTLYLRLGEYVYPQMFAKAPADPEKLSKLDGAFEFLNTFLQKSTWVAGDSLTIADLSLLSSVSTAVATGYSLSKYPKVEQWYAKVKKEVPNYEKVNGEGAEQFGQWYKSIVGK